MDPSYWFQVFLCSLEEMGEWSGRGGTQGPESVREPGEDIYKVGRRLGRIKGAVNVRRLGFQVPVAGCGD